MATDDGPMNDELPRHSSEESLPCGEASVSVTVRSNAVGKPLSGEFKRQTLTVNFR